MRADVLVRVGPERVPRPAVAPFASRALCVPVVLDAYDASRSCALSSRHPASTPPSPSSTPRPLPRAPPQLRRVPPPCAAADALKFKEEFEIAQKAMAAIKGESPAKPAESPAKSDKEAPTEAKSPALD